MKPTALNGSKKSANWSRTRSTWQKERSLLKNRYPKKIGSIVTGVAGFIGSHLAERLLSQNYHVVGVDNFFSGRKENLSPLLEHPNFTFHEHSVTEPGLLRQLKTQHPHLECCFHLAAIVSVPYSVDHPDATLKVNYHSAVDLLRQAEQLDFRAFIFAGSSAEYGDEKRLPLREEYATESTGHSSAYGLSKYLASREVAASRCGVALRCFNVYGPRQDPTSPYSGVISRFVNLAKARKPLTIFGDGRQTRDFIYVSDVVEAYVCAARLCASATGSKKRRYNVGTGESIEIMQLAELINNLLENPALPAYGSERPGDIRFSVASVEAFHRDAGWKPRVSLREGLLRTIKWAKGKGETA
jgi:UDP-glucose 4-epimerase